MTGEGEGYRYISGRVNYSISLEARRQSFHVQYYVFSDLIACVIVRTNQHRIEPLRAHSFCTDHKLEDGFVCTRKYMIDGHWSIGRKTREQIA